VNRIKPEYLEPKAEGDPYGQSKGVSQSSAQGDVMGLVKIQPGNRLGSSKIEYGEIAKRHVVDRVYGGC